MPGRLILRAAHSRFAARYLIPGAAIESLSRRLLVHSSHLCALVMREPLSATSWVEAGRTLQRVWLTAEHYQAAIQPWAVLPFMARHRECPKPRTLSGGQEDEVGQLTADLRAAFGVYEHEHPFFVFRLFRAAKPAVRAARRPWKAFTSVRADVATEDD